LDGILLRHGGNA